MDLNHTLHKSKKYPNYTARLIPACVETRYLEI
jgi:hypothetical protein